MAERVDIVIVGGGVAGCALAANLARGGLDVLVLEKHAVHRDRVRGEFLTPWGVAEAQKLGLYDALLKAGAHHTTCTIPFGESVSPDAARARAIDLTSMIEGVPGGLCMQHVAMCNTLDHVSRDAGATVIRPVERVEVVSGEEPEVRFVADDEQRVVHCRVIVGADGRGSTVARQAGIVSMKDPPHHIFSGLLVSGVEAWPEAEQVIGVEEDHVFYVFPQGGGMARLYLAHERSTRFSGPDGAAAFLDAFKLRSVPDSDVLAHAKPAGPCHGYPNEDVWCDQPAVPGVVLIGDAAGHNDPSIGQGLAITLRDVRLVKETLLDQWSGRRIDFHDYVQERGERMRRLRFIARLNARIRAEFGDEARARRAQVAERAAADPSLLQSFRGMFLSPDAPPPEAFDGGVWERLGLTSVNGASG
jgi:2-polyprenyl-6-methoxyphenol hydroxylase-like FAD-dependent oxidoreductase